MDNKKIVLTSGDNIEVIYKYCKCETASSILKDISILLCNPATFNDPFDSRIDVEPVGNTEEWEEYLHKYKVPKKKIHDIIANPDRVKQILLNKFKQQVIAPIRVSCFSKDNDNILLWSHYGDKHKGVCIGFKVYNEYKSNCMHFKSEDLKQFNNISPEIVPLLKVKYSDVIPNPYNPLREKAEKTIEFVLTKGKSWEYENEYRIVLLKKEGILKEKPVHLATLQEVSSIIFGIETTKDCMCKIKKIIKDKDLKVNLFRADKDKSKYKVNIVEIK